MKSGWLTLFAYISSSRHGRMMKFGVLIKEWLKIHCVKFGSCGSKGSVLAFFLPIFFWKTQFLKGVHVFFWHKNSLVMFSMQNYPCMQISMLCSGMAAPFPLKSWLWDSISWNYLDLQYRDFNQRFFKKGWLVQDSIPSIILPSCTPYPRAKLTIIKLGKRWTMCFSQLC